MSGVAPETLPANREQWEAYVKQRKLEGKTVHAAELASGSKIGYNQFLLLRVLWVTHKKNVSLPEKVNQLLPKAVKMLADCPSWKAYCDSFGKSKNPEGSFAVARHYQKMAAKTEENTRPNSFDTPLALRRPKRNVKTLNISKLNLEPPETPSKTPSEPLQTPVISPADDESILDDEDERSPLELITPAAQVPADLQKLMFPPTKDEQILNTALVVFLNALTIHFDVSETCNWTMHRKALIAAFEEASFEARTDGYLDDGQENAYALIEVKPVIRAAKENLIRMQESAQMVGWLKSDAGEINAGKGIHVSQDRHEIFLIFAEYDDEYLAYLRNEKPAMKAPDNETSQNETAKNATSPFLTMHQYGPWNTEDPSHMAELGPILLAITLYADVEIRAKQESEGK